MINTIFDLARETGVGGDIDAATANRRIASRLFKDTECGISFRSDCGGVVVAGYCEGTDAECPPIALSYPFPPETFWDAVQQADKDGCDLWDEVHG
jgi:hypothetical protein